MDSFPQYLGADISSMGNNMCEAGVSSVDPTLQLNSRTLLSSHIPISPGGKRKFVQADDSVDLQDSSELVLGLGHSSSCITMSSGKEIQESSIDLDLKINLQSQNGETANHKKASFVEKNKLDLELSLSTEPADSSISMTLNEGFSPFPNKVVPSMVRGSFGLVDEGSISSRWKQMNFMPQLHSSKSVDDAIPSNYARSNISSAAVNTPRSSGNPVLGVAQQQRRSTCEVSISSRWKQMNFVPQLNSSKSVDVATPNYASSKTSSAAVNTPRSSVNPGLGVSHQQRRNTCAKNCQFTGCTRGARGASGLCISHGGGRRCQRADCQKGAEGKTVFCKAHGGGKRCQHLGCVKSAEGRTDFCITHGGGRRCSYESCTRAARGKSGRCIRHGGGKRCNMENCSKSAEGISGFCISHGGGRRCQRPDCGKGAQGSTSFCKAHGGGKRCTFLGCTKGAEGSTPFCKGHGGGKRCSFESGCTKSVHGGTFYCVNHGGGKRCVEPGCTKSARGRTDYCVRHGGGRRCQSDGCGKSAQGSTDFCKLHGGGKRCSWEQLAVVSGGGQGCILPCDRFARGRTGLCASHTSQEQGKHVQGGGTTTVHALYEMHPNASDSGRSTGFLDYEHHTTPVPVPVPNHSPAESSSKDFALPEGRVHGGNLLAMLKAGTSFELKP